MADDRRPDAVEGRRYRIQGRVQGVGYRAFAYRAAQALGVSGSVRNLRDGAVEVVAWGPTRVLDELESVLREGPRWGRVDHLVASPSDRLPPEDGSFVIERDG